MIGLIRIEFSGALYRTIFIGDERSDVYFNDGNHRVFLIMLWEPCILAF
jgi:hypothetical protein